MEEEEIKVTPRSQYRPLYPAKSAEEFSLIDQIID